MNFANLESVRGTRQQEWSNRQTDVLICKRHFNLVHGHFVFRGQRSWIRRLAAFVNACAELINVCPALADACPTLADACLSLADACPSLAKVQVRYSTGLAFYDPVSIDLFLSPFLVSLFLHVCTLPLFFAHCLVFSLSNLTFPEREQYFGQGQCGGGREMDT